jgi:hypothetical protein
MQKSNSRLTLQESEMNLHYRYLRISALLLHLCIKHEQTEMRTTEPTAELIRILLECPQMRQFCELFMDFI